MIANPNLEMYENYALFSVENGDIYIYRNWVEDDNTN